MRLKWICLAASPALVCGAVAQDEARPVEVAAVTRAAEKQVLEMTGSVTARRQARLSARTAGLVEKLAVDAGSVVKQGDVLMELDDALAELAVEKVVAEREQAELEVAEARRLADEVRDLAKSGAFSQSEATTRVTNLKLKSSALLRGQVQEKEQREILERHRLVAPFDGVISRKLTEEGEWVTTSTPVVELVETEGLRLDVQVPQEWVARLKGKPAVTVTLDAYPERTLAGGIDMSVPVKDPVARTFLVRIGLEDPDKLAAPGMSGRVRFTVEQGREVTQVPRDAVVRFADGTAKVWIIREEGGHAVAKPRDVKVGGSLGGKVEVLEGLDAGEKVVVRGNESLRDGTRVEVLGDATRNQPAGE